MISDQIFAYEQKKNRVTKICFEISKVAGVHLLRFPALEFETFNFPVEFETFNFPVEFETAT